ncbi:MAG: hypothetical protein K8T91_19115 [Planctomycetes bacterium]|nr:hypothetical protein [Planctomycetota bacterium]
MTPLTYDIELRPGETLHLPQTVVDRVGAGHWRITIAPLAENEVSDPPRGHSAFLSGYALEDEGLYDDYPTR